MMIRRKKKKKETIVSLGQFKWKELTSLSAIPFPTFCFFLLLEFLASAQEFCSSWPNSAPYKQIEGKHIEMTIEKEDIQHDRVTEKTMTNNDCKWNKCN